MEIRKNIGLILIILGILLTLDKTSQFSGLIGTVVSNFKQYWPAVLCVLGLYLICTSATKK